MQMQVMKMCTEEECTTDNFARLNFSVAERLWTGAGQEGESSITGVSNKAGEMQMFELAIGNSPIANRPSLIVWVITPNQNRAMQKECYVLYVQSGRKVHPVLHPFSKNFGRQTGRIQAAFQTSL